MKNVHKIIIIVSLCIYLSLGINCAKANNTNPSQDPNSSLNNENLLLIKTTDKPTVYFVTQNKRHKILTAEVFLDYGFKWNDIKIVTNEQLKQYPKAKVAKSSNSSRVYYINESLNKKKFIPTGKIFLAYQNKWEDIITISQKDIDSYSNINVIKSASGPKIYELKDGIKKAINNPQEFISKGYNWGEIIIVKNIEIDYYPTKMAVNGEEVVVAGVEYDENEYEEEQDDFISQIVSGDSYLSIKTIKQDKEIAVPSGSIVPMLQLQLTAGLEKPVNVNFLKISRAKGMSSIDNVVVIDENNNVLGSAEMLDKNYVTIRLKPEIYIAPNKSKIININASTKHDDHIVYEQLFIESEKDISTSANIEGTFPLSGDRIKVIPGSGLIGNIEVGTVVISNGLRNTYIGETDYLITKFAFSETTGNEDVYLKMLKITNSGSGYIKLANVDLIDQDNHVIATVTNPTGSSIVFDISRSPYKIPKGSSRIFGIKADIIDGAGGNIKFEIKSENDILVTGKEYLFNLVVSSKEGSSFPIGRGDGKYVNMLEINDVDIAVYKNSLSSVGGLVAGSDEQSLGIFDIRVNGSTINYKTVTLQIINGDKVNLEGDLIIRDYKTKKILGQIQAGLVSNGPTVIDLDVYPKIETKQTFVFEVLGNIDDKATILDTYQLKITGIDFQIVASNMDHYFDCESYGNILSVKRSNLIINSNSKFKDAEVATGKTNVLIGAFTIQAGIAEDLIINNFEITEASSGNSLSYNEGYSNLKIYIKYASKKYSTIYETPMGGQFIVNKPIALKAGGIASIVVYVDTSPLVDTNEIKLAIKNVNAYGKISGLEPSQTGNGSQSFNTKFIQSRLIITQNTEMGDTVITAGKNNQKIASFRFENKGVESIVIKNFTLAETANSDEVSYANGYSYIKISSKRIVKQPIAGGNIFGSVGITAGSTLIVDVYINPDATTVGDQFSLVFKDIVVAGGIVVEGDYVIGQGVRVVGD